MSPAKKPLNYLDGPRLAEALAAGIRHLFLRRDYINRINVFPVPDGDTGTNMAFTFRDILTALESGRDLPLDDLLTEISDAALDSARGNSGAIMAQFFQGCREAVGNATKLDAGSLALVCRKGAELSWSAMSEPVAGTLPTVLEDFAVALAEAADSGETDIRAQFLSALEAARASLANTPELLPVLKQAGVVDAGGQGFVDLLEGIRAWVEEGVVDELVEGFDTIGEEEAAGLEAMSAADIGEHRFCTECVIDGQGLDRQAVMARLKKLDHTSMVVAGGETRIRVHIHVNSPAEVFLACEAFGEITQQKADDMAWQHGLLNQPGKVAIVTDSGGDLPVSEAERLGIHIVPVRLSFGDREYLDGVSMKPADFYRMLEESDKAPQTSQPPPADFRRVYELLAGHGYDVLHVGLSKKLSGTTRAAETAAGRVQEGQVKVLDTLNVSCGQGLLAMVAAEAAADNLDLEEVTAILEGLLPLTRTMAMPDELTSAVRGGRVPAWIGKVARGLRIMPVLQTRDGGLGVAGATVGRGFDAAKLAKRVLKNMVDADTYRVLISHCDNPDGARAVRRSILAGHDRIHSCHLAEAGPALGAHLGRGGVIVGFLPWSQ
jgi:DegV family protein with EDD domain